MKFARQYETFVLDFKYDLKIDVRPKVSIFQFYSQGSSLGG